MSRGARLAVGAAALVALLVWAELGPGPPDWIVPESPAAISRLRIDYAGRAVQFARGPAGWRSESLGNVLAERSGPGFTGVASPDPQELPRRIEWVLERLCRGRTRVLPAASVRGAEFGLDPPVLRLTLSGRRTYHLDVGGLPPSGAGRYFRLQEPERAGLLPRDVAGELTSLAGGGPQH